MCLSQFPQWCQLEKLQQDTADPFLSTLHIALNCSNHRCVPHFCNFIISGVPYKWKHSM